MPEDRAEIRLNTRNGGVVAGSGNVPANPTEPRDLGDLDSDKPMNSQYD
jgi:hypothetical protein